MHLLAPLAAGMAGAESGTVDVYARGTSTPITLYTDFEGTVTTANPATLDASGRAKLYVAEYARCLVKNSSGSTVIDFVDGKDANAVELRSASIIGNAYSGGAAAAGNPISVEAAFNKLITSFGSTDFNVLLASASVTMQAALGALWRARVFDVRQYGALGDGATNDLAAVNAAASAANAAGGGTVFFPPGTYQITAALTMFSTVEYVGVGPALSVVRAASDFAVFSGSTMPLAVRKLGIDKSGSMTTWVGVTGGSTDILFEDCVFSSATVVSGIVGHFGHQGTGRLMFRRCTMRGTAGSATRMFAVRANGEMVLEDCSVSFVSGGYQGFVGGSNPGYARLTIVRTTFDLTSIGSGAIPTYGVLVSDYAILRMHQSRSIADSDITSEQNAIAMQGSTESYVIEEGNDFSSHYAQLPTESDHGPYSASSTPAVASARLGTRALSALPALNMDGTPIVVLFLQARTSVIRTTGGAGTRVINADNSGANGEAAVLVVHNDTGASITYQWGSQMASSGATFAVAANSVRTFGLVFVTERVKWFIVSDVAGAETAE